MEKSPSKNAWRYDAKCADPSVYPEVHAGDMHNERGHRDTELFFPPRDADAYAVIADAAKDMCYGRDGFSPCPVRRQCLWAAIQADEEHGILGGKSHRERNAIIRRHQRTHPEMTLEEYVHSDYCK